MQTLKTSFQGSYLFIDTSPPARAGDKAVLVSQQLVPDSGKACFQFWYYMYGYDVDTLTVRLRYWTDGGLVVAPGAEKFVVWSMKGDQGAEWKYAQVSA